MGNQTEREAVFVSHESCPRCGSKDNLGVWSDGHKWCFGCGYYKPAVGTLSTYFPSSTPTDTGIHTSLHRLTTNLGFLSTNRPSTATSWLKSYGLTNEEITNLGILWDESKGLLIFPMYEGEELIGYVGRQFLGKGPKYVVQGEKQRFKPVYGSGDTLVLTEDLISAVKVGRVTVAMPLFGIHVREVPAGYSKYKLWLDKDKQISSVQQCRKWRQYGYDIESIITDLDPKEYNEQQIREYLK